jgi:hypothetical protein
MTWRSQPDYASARHGLAGGIGYNSLQRGGGAVAEYDVSGLPPRMIDDRFGDRRVEDQRIGGIQQTQRVER